MKKLSFVLGISLLIVNSMIAQPGQLMIKGGSKGLYVDHSVVPKEGLFAIGRLYNVSPRTIASFNALDMSKGLSIGQVIHIPLTDTNFSQKSNKGRPLYYKTADKETLLKVSAANNKVAMQKLRDWNKLQNDNIKAGSKLIVGFLVSDNAASITVANPVKEETVEPYKEKPFKADSIKSKPVVKNAEPKDKPVVKKEEPKKEEPKKEEPKKEEIANSKVIMDMSGQGYFKSVFDQQVKAIPVSKTETVTSGIFKTTSGMQDAKYYVLADGVPSGTVVRVINPDNNKTIYAKVLGEMGSTRINQGLNIRISNVAASSLGIAETDKFIVKINY